MAICAMKGCNSNSRKTKITRVKLFRFPNNEYHCQKWLSLCQQSDNFNWKNGRVCSLHFKESDFTDEFRLKTSLLPAHQVPPKIRRPLKLSAVPSLNLPYPRPERKPVAELTEDDTEISIDAQSSCQIADSHPEELQGQDISSVIGTLSEEPQGQDLSNAAEAAVLYDSNPVSHPEELQGQDISSVIGALSEELQGQDFSNATEAAVLHDSNPVKDNPKASQSNSQNILSEMKYQHAKVISKHRMRFSRLQKKYMELERDYRDVKDVGTRSQIVRDAKEYLSEEHHLFFESQLFTDHSEGKGNRFSKKFMKLMLQLYNESPVSYKYLNSIFTIPSRRALEKYESQVSSGTTSPTCVQNGHQEYLEGLGRVGGTSGKATTSLEEDLNFENCNSSLKSELYAERMSLDHHSEADELMKRKSWFKVSSGMSEPLPTNHEEAEFLSSDVKRSFFESKIATWNSGLDKEEEEMLKVEDEEEKDYQFELGEIVDITSFNNIAKKVMDAPYNASPVKHVPSLNWDEIWGSKLIE